MNRTTTTTNNSVLSDDGSNGSSSSFSSYDGDDCSFDDDDDTTNEIDGSMNDSITRFSTVSVESSLTTMMDDWMGAGAGVSVAHHNDNNKRNKNDNNNDNGDDTTMNILASAKARTVREIWSNKEKQQNQQLVPTSTTSLANIISSDNTNNNESKKKSRLVPLIGALPSSKLLSFSSGSNSKHSSSSQYQEQRSTDSPSSSSPTPPTNAYDDDESCMTIGTSVYVRDIHYSWLPATIETPTDDKGRVRIMIRLPSNWDNVTVFPKSVNAAGDGHSSMKMDRLIYLSDYPNNELPLQNNIEGKADMADLSYLHEAAILYNLKSRHVSSLPYTRVGDILVAVNPFVWIKDLYSMDQRDFYAKNLIWQSSSPSSALSTINDEQQQSQKSSSKKVHILATAAVERKALGYEYEKLGIQPHVYETSSLSYYELATTGINQTILVTGESGAGKTETIKIVMNHLATVERSRPTMSSSGGNGSDDGSSQDTVTKVLQANPLFEAFGNAKTIRNDNSSRFGKFTQLLFDIDDNDNAEQQQHHAGVPRCHLVGSKCMTYLLEKSRVVSTSVGERTFHIFYQLLNSPYEYKCQIWKDGLVNATLSDFVYLSNTTTLTTTESTNDGLVSVEHWMETVQALSTFGIHDDAFINVMRSLCIILQLGNITFTSIMQDGAERSVINSNDELDRLSHLLGVSTSTIETALTKRFMITRGEEFTIFLTPNEARDGCDALAKEIYARIFDLLVTKCNEATMPPSTSTGKKKTDKEDEYYGTISLLDIFGFESFVVNRFEQLCINYANERLQQKYVIDTFQAIQHEYEAEGVNVFDFSQVDNTDVVELLEGKLGLITQLNEECMRRGGMGGDENFVYKFKVVNSDSIKMIQDHLHRPYEFGIRHYAAPIKYDARQFIERNLDKIPAELLHCACQSTNPLIRDEFLHLSSTLSSLKANKGPSMRSESLKHFVFTKFKHQLTSLMSLIETSRTRYIRCIKPNKEMTPKIMDHAHTISQLESAGLVTAIVISRESFPNRLSYDMVMERFRFLQYKLGPNCVLDSGDIKIDVDTLLSHLLAGVTANSHKEGKVKAYACGKTRVYFRAGALETIETTRQAYYAASAIVLQAWFRSLTSRNRFINKRMSVIRLQSIIRCYLARKSLSRLVHCALIVQCFIRKCLAEKERIYRRRERASTAIQTRWRGGKPRQQFKVIREAAISIQCLNRMIVGKKIVAMKKKERSQYVAMESRMSVVQQAFSCVGSVQGSVFSVDEGLLDEVETMFDFLRKEIVVLRKKNMKLKKDLAEAETDKREIFKHSQSLDHSFAVAKIRNEQMSKTNNALFEDNSKRRKEMIKLKNELKTQQQAHEAQLQEMRSEFETALRRRDSEVTSIAQHLQLSASAHKRELQQVRDEAERKQNEHFSQISRLREEVMNTQNSHQDYLSKLMDVLETTQESRRAVSAISDETHLLRRKEDEILMLKEKVAKLRHKSEASTNDVVDTSRSRSKNDDIKSMKKVIKKNREGRKSRVQYLGDLANQLEASLALGDLSQVNQLLMSMKETVQKGEKESSKIDRAMVNMLDNAFS